MTPEIGLRRRVVIGCFAAALVAAGVTTAGVETSPTSELAATLDRMLSSAYPPREPGAAVIVTAGGTTLLRRGYGVANLEHDIAVTPETVLRLASVTKVLTATAVLRLVERGVLSLDDPVAKHVEGLSREVGRVPIASLLSHSSGVPDYLDRPDSMAFARGAYGPAELIALVAHRPLHFTPGTRTAYSNSNYILLGAVLERLTGSSLDAVLTAEVFAPAAMSSARLGGELEIVPRRAGQYEPVTMDAAEDWTRFRNARYISPSVLSGAGGGLASADDMAAFLGALLGGRLLAQETLAMVFEPDRLADGSRSGTTRAGWQIEQAGEHRAFAKGGALPGTCTWVIIVPDPGVTVTLLSNRSAGRPRAGQLALELAALASSAR